MMNKKMWSLAILSYTALGFLAVVNSGCSRDLPEIELGSITEFSETGNRFSVDVKNSNLGWFLGIGIEKRFDLDKSEEGRKLLDSSLTITVLNTSETQLGTSFRRSYTTILPDQSGTVYEGTFRDFWYEGGALKIHNHEPKLTYSVIVKSEYHSILKNPIRLYLYTRDAPIFPSIKMRRQMKIRVPGTRGER
jgi:hypothetical protein